MDEPVSTDLTAEVERLRTEVDRLRAELAERPIVDDSPHDQRCGDCGCCTEEQCGSLADNECPTNALGDSTCPCTCF